MAKKKYYQKETSSDDYASEEAIKEENIEMKIENSSSEEEKNLENEKILLNQQAIISAIYPQENSEMEEKNEEICHENNEIINSDEEKIQRIAIVMKNFMQPLHCGHNAREKMVKAWTRGQIVFNEDDIDMLLELNAPIDVYFKYVD